MRVNPGFSKKWEKLGEEKSKRVVLLERKKRIPCNSIILSSGILMRTIVAQVIYGVLTCLGSEAHGLAGMGNRWRPPRNNATLDVIF